VCLSSLIAHRPRPFQPTVFLKDAHEFDGLPKICIRKRFNLLYPSKDEEPDHSEGTFDKVGLSGVKRAVGSMKRRREVIIARVLDACTDNSSKTWTVYLIKPRFDTVNPYLDATKEKS
jgi:hypothetical protein